MIGAPSLPVTLNTTEEEQSEGPSGSQQSGITSLSEPVFLVVKDHAMVPSIEVFCTML